MTGREVNMSRETIEMYSQNNFDQDAHIAEFLQTSRVYLGVSDDYVTAVSNLAWLSAPAILSQEAPHA